MKQSNLLKYDNVSWLDLEFEDGKLVKVQGMRYNYMDGYDLQSLVRGLGKLVYKYGTEIGGK